MSIEKSSFDEGDKAEALAPHWSNSTGKDDSIPPTAHTRGRRVAKKIYNLLRVFLIMASVGWYFCASDKYITRIMRQVTTGGQEWRHHTPNLPEFYSLCSRDAHGIYTSEAGNEWVQCVTVQNGVIVDVGDLAHVTSEQYYLNGKHSEVVPRSTPGEFLHQVDIRSIKPRIIHLPTDSFMSPGLVDSHAHSLQYGWSRQLPLRGSVSVDDVIAKVNAYAKSHQKQIAEGQWIEGAGWDQNIWPVKSFPNATDFDRSKALRDLPIALKRIDIHAEWVSPKVLEMMGDLPEEVPGGQIMRDADGKPTGVFLDDAMFLIDKVRPRWSETQMQEYLNITIEDALSKGLVAIHDGGVVPEQVEFFQRAGKAGHLPIRFYIMRACPDKEKYCGDEYPMMIGDANNHLNVKSVKLFADGALGSWGAALLEPYSDKPEEYGTMRSPEKVWEPLIKDFVRNGWQVNVHCIGDRANHIVLNAMERALMELPEHERGGRRLRIEHAQIMKLEDLERAAKLGIIASYQPTHATSDMWYAEDRLGPERIKGAYAWRRYLQAGGRITLGSDFPVESIDPLKGFYAAVTRLDEEGNSPMGKDGWYPEQKLSREEALRGMTIDAAYASFLENKTGSFSVGKQFDAVVWSQSLISTPQDTILDTRVLSTIIDGKAVWGKLFQSAHSNPQAFRRDPSRVWSYSVAHSPEGSAG